MSPHYKDHPKPQDATAHSTPVDAAHSANRGPGVAVGLDGAAHLDPTVFSICMSATVPRLRRDRICPGGFTADIVGFAPNAAETVVASDLPSDQTGPGRSFRSGVADVAFIGHRLYGLLAGVGCSRGHLDADNGIIRVYHDASRHPQRLHQGRPRPSARMIPPKRWAKGRGGRLVSPVVRSWGRG